MNIDFHFSLLAIKNVDVYMGAVFTAITMLISVGEQLQHFYFFISFYYGFYITAFSIGRACLSCLKLVAALAIKFPCRIISTGV